MDKNEENNKQSKKSLWTLGDKNWVDITSALLLPFLGLVWGGWQFFNQKQVENAKILEAYFTSLQSSQSDILKYSLEEKNPGKARESIKIIQSFARAKTLLALKDVDPVSRGTIIEYLHNLNFLSNNYSDYDSSHNYICNKLKADFSLMPRISLFQDNTISYEIDLSNKSLPGIEFVNNGIKSIKNITFESTNLDCSSFKGTTIEDTKFNDALLRGADFSASFLKKVDFSGSVLSDADFSEAILVDVNLKNANLKKTYLSNVKGLTSVQLKTARNWDKAFYKYDEKCDEKNKKVEYIVNKKANEDYIKKIKNDEVLPPPSPKPPIKCSFNQLE